MSEFQSNASLPLSKPLSSLPNSIILPYYFYSAPPFLDRLRMYTVPKHDLFHFNCVFDGGISFPVSTTKDDTVGMLKERILFKTGVKGMVAQNLMLWKVSIPSTSIKVLGGLTLSSDESLDPAVILSTIFSNPLEHGHVHIIVQSPVFISTSPNDSCLSAILSPASSNFIPMAESHRFVDKSQALCDFLEDGMPIHLLLRPRRTGKSTLLTMFRTFFERTDPAENKSRRNLFFQNGLAITQQYIFDTEFGRYPVLYVDLSNVGGANMEELYHSYKFYISEIVERLEKNGFLNNLEELHHSDRTFIDGARDRTLDDAAQLPIALSRLTEVLCKLNHRRVILLVDEYDTPTSNAVQHNYFEKANQFFRNVFSTLLKNNEHLRGALLVGILRVSKAGWLSGVNNLRVFSLGDTREYSTACMFTEQETLDLYKRQNQILQTRGKEALRFTFEELGKWYNGYSSVGGTKLYNPWSVSTALVSGTLGPFWVNSGYDVVIEQRISHMLSDDPQFYAQMTGLLSNRTRVEVQIDDEMSYESVPKMTATQLWTLMYYAGYLTKALPVFDSTNPGNDICISTTSNLEGKKIAVSIPNKEIRSLFQKWLLKDIDRGESSGSSIELFHHMIHGPMDVFALGFAKLVYSAMPRKVVGRIEDFYQVYIHAYLASAADAINIIPAWEVDMEVPAGSGRCDVVIQRKGGEYGALIELKRLKHDIKDGYSEKQCAKLTASTTCAMEQLLSRNYRAKMRDNITQLFEYGLAFLGPYCAIEARHLKREVGGQWIVTAEYSAKEDEKRRAELYRVGSTSS